MNKIFTILLTALCIFNNNDSSFASDAITVKSALRLEAPFIQ